MTKIEKDLRYYYPPDKSGLYKREDLKIKFSKRSIVIWYGKLFIDLEYKDMRCIDVDEAVDGDSLMIAFGDDNHMWLPVYDLDKWE